MVLKIIEPASCLRGKVRASIADMEAVAQLLGHANIKSVAERKLS